LSHVVVEKTIKKASRKMKKMLLFLLFAFVSAIAIAKGGGGHGGGGHGGGHGSEGGHESSGWHTEEPQSQVHHYAVHPSNSSQADASESTAIWRYVVLGILAGLGAFLVVIVLMR
jgi:hypothetical protein